jgi:metal-responsive CopG/Arc/MetJ family transcriptional regulator
MSQAKVAISIDQGLLSEIDELVRREVFANRSQAIQAAVRDKIARLRRTRLARECAKLDPKAERRSAEEGLEKDVEQWPEY